MPYYNGGTIYRGVSIKALAIIRNQSITVTTPMEGGHNMAKKELSHYAPDRWIRELNRRYQRADPGREESVGNHL